jgi:hypothetical protein
LSPSGKLALSDPGIVPKRAATDISQMAARPCPFYRRSLLSETAKDKTVPSL